MIKYLLASVLLFSSTALATDECISPVPGWGRIPTDAYPAVAQVDIFSPELEAMGHCSGTLIGAHFVLTAAHCVEDAGMLVWGEIWPSLHWAVIEDTDIAVLRLLNDVEGIEPAHLPLGFPKAASKLAMVGYGCSGACLLEDGISLYGPFSKKVSIFPAAGFDELYRSDTFWICWGDSGGPVLTDTGAVLAIASAIFSEDSGLDRRFTYMKFELVPQNLMGIFDAMSALDSLD